MVDVPSDNFQLLRVLRASGFSSSTEWWTFQLCYGYSGRKLWRFRSCVSWGCVMLCSTVDTYSASARAIFGIIPGFQCEWVDSAPEVDSRPALLSSWPRAVACFQWSCCAPRAVFPTFGLSQNGEVCTVDASTAEQFFLGNLDNISLSSLYLHYFQLSAGSAR